MTSIKYDQTIETSGHMFPGLVSVLCDTDGNAFLAIRPSENFGALIQSITCNGVVGVQLSGVEALKIAGHLMELEEQLRS